MVSPTPLPPSSPARLLLHFPGFQVKFTITQLKNFSLTPKLADTLDRYEMPFFGGLASSFVDAE